MIKRGRREGEQVKKKAMSERCCELEMDKDDGEEKIAWKRGNRRKEVIKRGRRRDGKQVNKKAISRERKCCDEDEKMLGGIK